MKKHQIFLTLAILAIIVATIFCFTYFARSTKDVHPNLLQNQNQNQKQTQGQVNFTSKPVSSQEISEIASSSMLENVYTLREYKGHIGVFENDDSTPIQEIDVLVDNLPASDRALLAKGIVARNSAELRSLLEDYSS